MTNNVDCLFIGHNEMDFLEYQETIRKMGENSGAFRDLNLNFIRYNNKPYSLSEIFNVFYYQEQKQVGKNRNFHVSESFNAAVAYLATYIHRRGFTFDYVNSFQSGKTQLKEILTSRNVRTVVLTTTLYVSVLPILEIIDFIRAHNREVKIILGGPFVSTRVRNLGSSEAEYLFKDTIDADVYVNSSQGEATLVRILEAIEQKRTFEHIPNIFYREGQDFKVNQVEREDNKIAQNMVDWNLFSDAGQYVNIRTAISCPFSCSFCGFPEHAGEYQYAGVEQIEKELHTLASLGSVKSVHFLDDTFNIPVTRFKDVLKMMIRNKFDFKWHSYFRCQYADEETVNLMKASGCEGVFLGIESGNDGILKNMNKAADVKKYYEGIKLLKEAGIVTFGNFIVGFPGETDDSLRDTIDFIENSGIDFFRAQLWYCEHITPIWKEREAFKIEGESFEWKHATMDSNRASDLVEKIFFSVKGPTWVPQYNFDFDSFWHLTHRGLSVEQVKEFLKSFNGAVKEKLRSPRGSETTYESLRKIQDACRQPNMIKTSGESEQGELDLDDNEASFEF